MSTLRKARFTSTKPSTHSRGSRNQLLLAMPPPQLGGLGLDLDGMLQHGVVAVPLHEVRSAHEGPMLGGAAVVVPQVEVGEVDGLRERLLAEQPLLAQAFEDVGGGLYLLVGGLDDLLGLVVDALHTGWVWHWRQTSFMLA